MATFYGVDVSRWQGDISWSQVPKGAKFAIIKATGGDGPGLYTDGKFVRNRDRARSVGIPRGYYHFGGSNNPIHEADYFCDVIGAHLLPGELIVLDSEFGSALDPGWCKTFLDHVKARTGVKPLIYMSQSKIFEHNWSAIANANYGLWVAHYGVKPTAKVPIKYWKFYAFHQYSSSGSCPGIAGRVDQNAFYAGSMADFAKYGKQKPAPAPVPTPAPVPKISYSAKNPAVMYITNKDADVWEFNRAKTSQFVSLQKLPKGSQWQVAAVASNSLVPQYKYGVNAKDYVRGATHGVNMNDLSVAPPVPAPTPSPNPEPTPTPTPTPEPNPYPTWFTTFWTKLIDAILGILGKK